jgi:uncharacterized protein with FMN-binding domain
MRRITWWLLSTVAALVLLFTYRTSTGGGTTASAATATAPTTDATADSGTGGSGSGGGGGGGGSTYQGSVVQTRWGAVQVGITVSNGKITSVAVPRYPSGNGRDQEINAYALPILKQETLSAQNASIATVSGATVTSNGYKQSLQSAIDAAHLS